MDSEERIRHLLFLYSKSDDEFNKNVACEIEKLLIRLDTYDSLEAQNVFLKDRISELESKVTELIHTIQLAVEEVHKIRDILFGKSSPRGGV